MADQLIQEQLQEFQETFRLFDEDRDERLSIKELGTMLNALGQNPTQQELRNMIAGLDHEDDRIDFADFLSLMAKKNEDHRD